MYTHITVVLDRTGSMEPIRKDIIGGFNSFLAEQRKVSSTRITLIQFDSKNPQEVVYSNLPVSEAPELTEATYVPRASTPLYDAVGQAIVGLGENLSAIPGHSRPDKVIFAIVTDGQENSSREYTAERVRAMLEHQRDVYRWEFVFLSADLDSFAQAQAIGIPMANAMAYDHTGRGTRDAFAAFASNAVCYAGGQSLGMGWSDEQRDEQENEKKRENKVAKR